MENAIKRTSALTALSLAFAGALAAVPSTAEAAIVSCSCRVTEVVDWNNGNVSASCQSGGNFNVREVWISATANAARAERFWSLATAAKLSGNLLWTKCDNASTASSRQAGIFWIF